MPDVVQTSIATAALRGPAAPRTRRRLPRGRSDEALVARLRGGDDAAFAFVFDRYHAGLLAFCRHMLGSAEEAEDALQHTFMAAYRALRATDDPIRLKAWLYTIARNRCLSVLRARREQVAFDEDRAATDGLAAEVERRAELRGLLSDLERLPEDQRAALVLFELGDHGHDEIAEVLGVRREKVKALVFQARESLMSWRRARETPCVEIREQLSTARGASLKRVNLRRHVERCEGCRAFQGEVRRQRAAMAVLLPVAPAAGLKSSILSSILGAGSAGAVAASGVGGGATIAGLGAAAKGLAAKSMLCAAVAGGAGSAGYVAVREVQVHRHPAPSHAAGAAAGRAPKARTHAPAATAPARPTTTTTTSQSISAGAIGATPQRDAQAHHHGRAIAGDHRGGRDGHRSARDGRHQNAREGSPFAGRHDTHANRSPDASRGEHTTRGQQGPQRGQDGRASDRTRDGRENASAATPRDAATPGATQHEPTTQSDGSGDGHRAGRERAPYSPAGGSRHAGVSPR